MNKEESERVASLSSQLAMSQAETITHKENAAHWKREAGDKAGMLDTMRAEIKDLKVRLATQERENERMRGYIERVHEDDVVREELVETGDPDRPSLVPKRKHCTFPSPDPYTRKHSLSPFQQDQWGQNPDDPKPKHWVTYG